MIDNAWEKTFHVNLIGDKTFSVWDGEFTVKTLLSHTDQMKQDAIRRDLLGPNAQFATDRALTQCDTFADLAVRIVKAPSWWKGSGQMDDNLVTEIHKLALQAEKEQVDELKKKGENVMNPLRNLAPST